MSLGNILALAGLTVVLGTPVATIGYNYKFTLWPRFLKAEAETNYTRCVRECHEMCEENGVVECKCGYCLKFVRGD